MIVCSVKLLAHVEPLVWPHSCRSQGCPRIGVREAPSPVKQEPCNVHKRHVGVLGFSLTKSSDVQQTLSHHPSLVEYPLGRPPEHVLLVDVPVCPLWKSKGPEPPEPPRRSG